VNRRQIGNRTAASLSSVTPAERPRRTRPPRQNIGDHGC